MPHVLNLLNVSLTKGDHHFTQRFLQIPKLDKQNRCGYTCTFDVRSNNHESAVRSLPHFVSPEIPVLLIGMLAACCGCSPSEADLQTEQAEQAVSRLTSASTPAEQEAALAELKANPAAAAVLKDSLGPTNLRQHEAIVDALGKIGPSGMPVLQELMAGEDRDLRRSAIAALPHQGEASVTVLTDTLDAGSEDQDLVLAMLAKLGADGAPAAKPVAERLNSSEVSTRIAAAQVLQQFGPAAAPVLPTLKEHLEQETDPGVHQTLAKTILSIGRGDAVSMITPYFADEELRYGYSVLIADQLGAAAVPGLCAALDDPNVDIRRQALVTLSYLDDDAQASLPELKRRLPLEPNAELRSKIERLIKNLEDAS